MMIISKCISNLDVVCLNIRKYYSSKHKIYQIKNNSMLIIQDQQHQLPYLSQIQLENGKRGVIMKIQEGGNAYLGLYDQFQAPTTTLKEIQITKINKNWKLSSLQFSKKILQQHNVITGLYDINNVPLLVNRQAKDHVSQQTPESLDIFNGKKRRVKTSSPILNACYDLYYGDMISFIGCRGSKKSEHGWHISKQFSYNRKNALTIYVNPSFNESKELLKINPHSICFTVPQHNKPTDIGVYMLTLKAIKLSNELKKNGVDVLLIIDNLKDIMLRQWNFLQTIKYNSKSVDSSKLFQYSSMRISPISILNQIYSNCEDRYFDSKPSASEGKPYKGSLTSILISEKQSGQMVQQITSYSNNLKHLQTLSKVIEFPINFKVNSNTYYQKAKTQEELQKLKKQPGYYERQLYRFLRSYINRYLRERKDTELKRQLYKTQLRDAPWDYFFILDAQWWTVGINQMKNSISTYSSATKFLKWLVFNIQHDHIGHWNITAKQSYLKLINYCKHQQNLDQNISIDLVEPTDQDCNNFIQDAKMEGWLLPFKKDYLL